MSGAFHVSDPMFITIALALFIGATGKSAQIPLYVWLPDAMEGPTPVSALIHAATMVTAGVYMVSRSNFIYQMAPQAMAVVAVVGALTAFFAASIALVQNDIKRVLAYSTVSQLGYMFLALGVGSLRRRRLPPDDARLLQSSACFLDPAASFTPCTTNRTCGRWVHCGRRFRSLSGRCFSGPWRSRERLVWRVSFRKTKFSGKHFRANRDTCCCGSSALASPE